MEETKKMITYPKSVHKFPYDYHQILLNLGKTINPSPLFGLGTKFIDNVVQCTSGKSDNNFPCVSQKNSGKL